VSTGQAVIQVLPSGTGMPPGGPATILHHIAGILAAQGLEVAEVTACGAAQ